jgi:hypothetical protein
MNIYFKVVEVQIQALEYIPKLERDTSHPLRELYNILYPCIVLKTSIFSDWKLTGRGDGPRLIFLFCQSQMEEWIHSKRSVFANNMIKHCCALNLERQGNAPAEQNHLYSYEAGANVSLKRSAADTCTVGETHGHFSTPEHRMDFRGWFQRGTIGCLVFGIFEYLLA